MINLAENGVTCDCGSYRLAPAKLPPGELIICGACAKTFRVELCLTPVPWSVVEEHFGSRMADMCAFDWHRNGVKPAARRTVAEIAARDAMTARIDRYGTVGGVLFVIAVLGFIARAVFS